MIKIVILDSKSLGQVPNLDNFTDFGLVDIYMTTSPEETIARIADADIVITNKVIMDKNIMDHCPNLKLICISATGMNNVDLKAAKEKGIRVKNAVGYSSQSVAQHTFALLFQLYNQIQYYDDYVKSGEYINSDMFTHYGPTITELHNKSFGIIGMGNIGKTVATIATSFGARVSYYSTSGSNTIREYPQLSLNNLLESSDIISIHAPLNDKTINLISADKLSIMKPSTILINVGRGGIVNEKDLARAIDRSEIGGACLDVFEKEPMQRDNPLLHVKYPEKLVLTPHNAWASIEARTKLVDMVYENIRDFLNEGA